MKRALAFVAFGVLTIAIVAALVLAHLRSGPGLPSGSTESPNLSGPVEVLWDSVGVPHIFAGSIEDAFHVQGMAHARHRLWQIEFFRRVATGTLSEILGEPALQSDRFLRTLGMHRVAARSVATLDAESLRYLKAYVTGLNQAVEHWSKALPPEFLILGFRPEPFTIEDVLAIERIMAWDLTAYDRELNEARARGELPPERYDRIRASFPSGGTTILGGRRGLGEADSTAGQASLERPPGVADASLTALLESARTPEELVPLLDATSMIRASNAWVVGGERSRSGRPLLANDMHLGLERPTLFYLVGLHAPGLDVTGMSIPGAPGIVAGRTGGMAWGFTNAVVDDADFFLERLDPDDSARYLTPEGSLPFTLHTEVIAVSGRERPDTLTVRETRHGPIMSPVEGRLANELIALKWVAHDDSSSVPAVLAMNRADDVGEFLRALEGFRTLHQNVVFADTAGEWGYWMAGRVPLRPGAARPPTTAPVPGWTGEWDWTGYLPFDQHPHARRPEAGFVVTANNRQVSDGIGDLISADLWTLPYRAERITRLIEARELHDAASMHAIQLDVVTLQGLRFRADAARGFGAAGDQEAAALLDAWDGGTGLDRVESTLFHGWHEGVRRALSRDVWGVEGGYVSESAVDRWIASGLPDSVSERAAGEALERYGLVEWGSVHHLHLGHPLGQVPLLQTLFGFARGGIPIPGSGQTVRVAEHFRGPDGRLRVTHGASQRHVTDLADPGGRGGFVLPGGQSGYPGGPHTADQLRRWLDGGLFEMPMGRDAAEGRALARWTVEPGG